MEIVFIILLCYLVSVMCNLLIALILEDSDWKYAKFEYVFIWPVLLYLLPRDLIKFINNYLNKNNLKQMNFKILGKAMGFMFLPTLGVLLMLLIGFFDPIMLWNWIKSDSGWAIFTRIIIFLLETGLVILLYFDYLKKDQIENIHKKNRSENNNKSLGYSTYVRDFYENGQSNDNYTLTYTEDPNIVIITRTPKNN